MLVYNLSVLYIYGSPFVWVHMKNTYAYKKKIQQKGQGVRLVEVSPLRSNLFFYTLPKLKKINFLLYSLAPLLFMVMKQILY